MSTFIKLIAIAITTIAFILVLDSISKTNAGTPIEKLDHQKETWISALEWCESRGVNTALNPMDRDGTPSYSNFQWKKSTFLYFGKLYGLIPENTEIEDVDELLKDYELQRNIVRNMVDDPSVNWLKQFPDCVKLKVGFPPK